MKDSLRRVARLFLASFLFLALYLAYLQFWRGPELAGSSLNRRPSLWEEAVERGGILASNGEVLAGTVADGTARRRFYPGGPAFAQAVGYDLPRLGKAGLEQQLDKTLNGQTGWRRWQNTFRRLAGRRGRGEDVVLTLDSRLQKQASELLAGRQGAAVVLEPKGGAVLALVSSPSFNPERLEEGWQSLSRDPASPLLNRAVQGLYPPGSTYKLVTGAAALAYNKDSYQRVIFCPGFIEIEGRRLNCPRPHGEVNFTQALAFSCNVYFATLGLEMGGGRFASAARAFGSMREIPFELPVQSGQVAPEGELAGNQLAASAIGQGRVLVSPLQMALIAAAVGNGGVMPRPYLVKEIRAEGRTERRPAPPPLMVPLGREEAFLLKESMVAVVEWGTGQAAALPGIRVAGKTGSAENPAGQSHAWFAGFAPADEPRAAVAVILENAGAGGQQAAPLARELLRMALER